MKIGRKFNMLSHGEYLHLLANYKRYTDFNSLGLFRSIIENQKLNLVQQLEIREAAVAEFARSFEFLQLKDPHTYFLISTLGQNLTVADERKAWEDIWLNQQKILASKKITHRNFGIYSKHDCGYETCRFRGMMVHPNATYPIRDSEMHFHTDKSNCCLAEKARSRKRDRKLKQQIVHRLLTNE